MYNYYVYEHIRLDTNQVFYVGKGKGNRSTRHYGRNKHWHNIVNKCGFEVRYIAKDIDEELSLLVEQERIDQLRRFGVELCNYTNGGEGVSGLKHSLESRQKMRESRLKYEISEEAKKNLSKALKGRKLSKEWIEKIAKANTGKVRSEKQRKDMALIKSKKVLCIDENKEFINAIEAGKHYKIAPSCIRRVCLGERKTAKKMRWKYI